MFFTLLGIVTFVNPLQPENAKKPIRVTLAGIVTVFNVLHSRNS